ncbi:hypothetical protein BC834DRAFT_845407 [Gloeopeniophorella convolvens]|nr:hypothetical protein BC834DRAFT_845407 [Gloeopeniophorella convolvens]
MSLLGNILSAVSRARTSVHNTSSKMKELRCENSIETKYVDLTIHFIGASGIPKTDVNGTSDPYFVAKLDDQIKYTFVCSNSRTGRGPDRLACRSTVKVGTLQPVWNELWHIKNVPTDATLSVRVMDKDDSMTDDTIGKFETTVFPGAKEAEIQGPVLRRKGGTFWLKIESRPPSLPIDKAPPYTFDGPIRYSRHYSPTVGRLTRVNDERLYSIWKVYIKGVPTFFGDVFQPWNRNYKAAQSIFSAGPKSLAVRSGIQTAHKMLYARSTRNGFGLLDRPEDVMALLHGTRGRAPQAPHRVKPAVYTYVIVDEDQSLRFSETGAAFFVDFASKHALHANCAERVRYSGEFHPRPAGGWAAFADSTPDTNTRWELVIDNNSGTYSPNKELLPTLQALLEYNFPSFTIIALDHGDPALKESREACREYALNFRGVKQEELQPHAADNEETLIKHAAGNHEAHSEPTEAARQPSLP